MKKFINPFHYIAGGKSLVIGIIFILLTSVIGYFSHTHFPDPVSVNISAEMPIMYYIIQNLANWLVFSTLIYLLTLTSTQSVRIVDVFGTQALARSPYLLAAFPGFAGSIDKFGKHLLHEYLGQGQSISVTTIEITQAIILIIVTLVLTIWLITWMYNAFRVSSNIKPPRSGVLFFVAIVVSIVFNQLITRQLIEIFS